MYHRGLAKMGFQNGGTMKWRSPDLPRGTHCGGSIRPEAAYNFWSHQRCPRRGNRFWPPALRAMARFAHQTPRRAPGVVPPPPHAFRLGLAPTPAWTVASRCCRSSCAFWRLWISSTAILSPVRWRLTHPGTAAMVMDFASVAAGHWRRCDRLRPTTAPEGRSRS